MKILMVCLGNICRSPMAEGIMRMKFQEAGIDAIVDSCGTGNWHSGEAPDKRSIAIAARNGLDISQQCARQFRVEDFENFDVIFAMDSSNYNDLLALTNDPESKSRVHIFLPFCGITNPTEVPDPWFGDERDFKEVYQLLDKACSLALPKLLTINR
jgi:protein-tyrosine phosphatase